MCGGAHGVAVSRGALEGVGADLGQVVQVSPVGRDAGVGVAPGVEEELSVAVERQVELEEQTKQDQIMRE